MPEFEFGGAQILYGYRVNASSSPMQFHEKNIDQLKFGFLLVTRRIFPEQPTVIFRKPSEMAYVSIVFTPPPVETVTTGSRACVSWWRWDPDANWRHPLGKNSSIDGKEDHPVVCVNHEDATAYAE